MSHADSVCSSAASLSDSEEEAEIVEAGPNSGPIIDPPMDDEALLRA